MAYTQEISRDRKACFLFLLDQSYSMDEPLGNSSRRKGDELVTAINAWLQNMTIRASGDQGIKDWMDIGVLGYRTDPESNAIIESALQGPMPGPKGAPPCATCSIIATAYWMDGSTNIAAVFPRS